MIKLNNFGTNIDLRANTISELFFRQAKALTEERARLRSIDIQFSDSRYRW